MSQRGSRDLQMRLRLAQAAAQFMAETGSQDFQLAKKKAMIQLGASETRNLPSNTEIQEEVLTYQRLFRAESQPRYLQQRREAALDAMKFLASFKPLLVGAVLSGSADEHSAVILHLFADTPEELAVYLLDNHIPYELHEKRLRFKNDQYQSFPAYHFLADDIPVHLVVFPRHGFHQIPLSTIDGKPMPRADRSTLKILMAEGQHKF